MISLENKVSLKSRVVISHRRFTTNHYCLHGVFLKRMRGVYFNYFLIEMEGADFGYIHIVSGGFVYNAKTIPYMASLYKWSVVINMRVNF